MTITISKSKLENESQLIEEIKDAFNTAIPPICFALDNREDIKVFASIFKSPEHGYHGKRISCKNAKSYAPSTYAAAEIYTLETDKFPIELFFKSIQDLEDFADGYLRAVETIPAPIERIPEQTPKEESHAEKESAIVKSTSREHNKTVHRDKYDVNPFAETFLDTVLKIYMVFGWILAIGSIVVSIFLAAEMKEYYIIILGVIAAAIFLLTYYFIWAINKVVINMSRSLYNINENLKNFDN